MATKNRDVELVIRAKNEASKTVDSVADALRTLKEAQDDVARSAGKTSGFIDKLGSELNRLNAESKGLDALSKIAGNMDRATSAIKRMEGTLGESNAEFERLNQESDRSAATIKKLEASLNGARAAFSRQTAAAAEAKNEQTKINAQVRQAETAYTRLAAKVSSVKAPNEELALAYIEQENALQSLLSKQRQAASGYTQQKAAVANAATALKDYQAQIKAAGQNQRVLKDSSEQIAASIERQNKAITRAKADLQSITATATSVSTALGGVAVSADKITAASENTAKAIELVNKALQSQKALSAGSSGGGAGVQASAQLQAARALRQSREEYTRTAEEATKLGRAVATAAQPTAELRQQFLLAQAAANQAKAAYEAQATSLSRLRGVTQGTVSAFLQRTAQTKASASADQQAGSSARTLTGLLSALARSLLGIQSASKQAAGGVGSLRSSFAALYGDSRQALSFMQRLRGELLGLSTQFIGFYAGVQQVGGVVNAFRTIEAAQNRLGAVFNQNEGKIANELKFLEGTAARLGIEFGVLSDEYAKFAIAADAANFTTDSTRKIFLSVAEAARVNKLSLENTQGVFLALQQIISKGKVSSEELRRQLGDRLPGAFNIFADAIGKSAEELDAMLQQGEVFATQDTLLKFADQLTSRFGGQLPKALQSVTTEIGKFQNNIFNAQAQVANGGFIEAFQRALQNLNQFFQSQEGVKFFTSLGAALGKFVDLLTVVVKNFDLLSAAVKLFVAYKLAQVFTQGSEAMLAFATQTRVAGTSLVTFRGNAIATAVAVNSLTNGLRAAGFAGLANGIRGIAAGFLGAARGATLLRAGFVAMAGGARLLLGALGGPIGLLITLGTILATNMFANWATDVGDATEALAEHERIMRAVAEAYGDTTAKIEDQGAKLKGTSRLQIEANMVALVKGTQNAYTELARLAQLIDANPFDFSDVSDAEAKLRDLTKQLVDNQINFDEYEVKFKEFTKTLSSLKDIEVAAKYEKFVDQVRNSITAAEDSALKLREMGSEMKGLDPLADAAAKRIDSMKQSVDGLTPSNDAAVASLKNFNTAINDLKSAVPEFANEVKQFDAIQKIEEDFKRATNEARTFGQAMQAVDLRAKALEAVRTSNTNFEAQFTANRGTPAGRNDAELVREVTRLAGELKLSAKDLLTAISFETGGTLNPSIRGGANNKYLGLIQFGPAEQKQWGITVASTIAEQVRAIGGFLKERGVKENDGLLQIYAAINAGNAKRINASDANNGGTPGTVLDKVGTQMEGHKQRAEGLLAAYAGISTEVTKQVELETKRGEEQTKARENFQKQIEDNTFELELVKQSAREQFIMNQLRQQEIAYKQAGLTLTDQERQKIKDTAGALFDKQNAEKSAGEERKRIEEAVNLLMERRKEILDQIQFAQESGDTSKTAELKTKLEETNLELQEAIANASAFYAKMGGPEADLANLKLDGMKNSLVQVKQGLIDGKQVTDLFVGGLGTAFTSVAESIAGVISGTMTLKEGLKAVGQAFLKFAADFLLQIGQMIVKQALLNALGGFFGGGGGGGGGFLAGLFHRGGVVGAPGGQQRLADPSWFVDAPRYHQGGLPGLASNELPAILKENEEVLNENDPRNVLNGGLSPGVSNTKIVNTFDGASFLEEALNSPAGEKIMLNYVKANSGAVKAAIGS